MKLVSVVIPAYNTPSELFRRCILSVVNQDYPAKEIIVIDDGSKADFAKELDEYSDKYSQIRIIHQANGGEGAARNTGIENSTGDYIVFVDADDGLAEGWITYAVKLLQENDADIVSGQVVRVEKIPEVENIVDDSEYTVINSDGLWKIQRDFFYFKTDAVDNLPVLDPGVCSKLIKKTCIDNIRFPIGIKISSDQVVNHQMLVNANKYIISNRISYYYVANQESVSHVYQPKAVDYMMQSMSLIEPVVINNRETKQAFNYRVLAEVLEGIQYAYFSDKKKLTIREKAKGVRYACNKELVTHSLQAIEIKRVKGFQWKLKAFLIKYKLSYAFVILKMISDIR